MNESKLAKLNTETQNRIYVNNVFGKKVNGYIGPVHDNNLRTIFAQARPNGQFFKLATINTETGEISGIGEQNLKDAQTVINAL